MVKKFTTGMHESYLYNLTTSAKLSIFLDHPPFDFLSIHLFTIPVFIIFYTNLRYG